jgi:signal transduction histidine kinase
MVRDRRVPAAQWVVRPEAGETETARVVTAIADFLTLGGTASRLYKTALDKVLEVMSSEYGSLRLFNQGAGTLDLVAARGFPPDYHQQFGAVKIGERSAGRIFRARAPVVWDNVQTDPSCAYLYLRRAGINSIAGVPLPSQEETIGTLIVASIQRGRFGDAAVQLLSGMAKVVAMAIENHRLLTMLRSHLDDLTKLTLRLEESDAVKHRLLSVISHEFRTPISIILGNIELLMDGSFGDLSPRQRDSLLSVRRNGTGLLFQVENALDVSQLEMGGATVHEEFFTVDDVRAVMDELFGDELARKRLTLRWEIAPALPTFLTDRTRIIKVFRNLLDNAIKFTETGGVTVRVSYKAGAESVSAEVEDSGIGIPQSQFTVIFDPFHQIDSSHTRLYGGMGLGLRSVKRMLELLGGGIEIESEVGRGSLFRFWFPAEYKRRG